MSYAENPVNTVERFAEIWVADSTDINRLIPELISVANETNRRPDSSYFKLRNDLLIDPDSGKPVLNFITKGSEYDVARKIQNWAVENDEGMAIWISPKLENVYPCNKALIYQISYTPDLQKSVQYSAILFDGDIESPESFRESLLTFEDNDKNLKSTLSWIEEVSGQDLGYEQDKEEKLKAAYFAEQIKKGVDKKEVVKQMVDSGFIGQHSVSCPPQSFGKYSLSNAKILIVSGERILCCTCPYCKKQVEARISGGKISCPNCSASVRWRG